MRANSFDHAEPEKPHEPGRLALLFPGQGSQRAGMAARLLEISRAARAVFEEADRELDFSLSRLCVEADSDELADTENTQPALLTTSIAYFEHLRERLREARTRLMPSLFAGHSLGQFSAAVASESLPLSEGLRLVRERGRIMKNWAAQRPGGLATIFGLDRGVLQRICEEASTNGSVGIAVHNAPGQYVISGDIEPLSRAMNAVNQLGGRAKRLPISVPGHTPVMKEAAREMERILSQTTFRDPNAPIVSNISGNLLTTAEEVRNELAGQICAAVEWVHCMGEMMNQGIATFVEVGPGRALSNIAGRFGNNLRFVTIEEAQEHDLVLFGSTPENQQTTA
jgi:[acyl-carrier-protein] S-malonyltransferase